MDAKKACAISWNKKRGSPFLCGGDRPARRGEPRRHGKNGRGLSMGPCIPRSTEAGRRPPEEMCSRRGPHLRALLSKWVYRRHFLVRRANESEHTTIPTGPAWRTGFDASRVFIEGWTTKALASSGSETPSETHRLLDLRQPKKARQSFGVQACAEKRPSWPLFGRVPETFGFDCTELNKHFFTTLSGGSLGSRVDEERSQLRDLV